jgi:hypothetical protein
MKSEEYLKIGFQIALAFTGFIAIKKIGETLGLFKSAEEKKAEQATSDANADSTEEQTANPYIGFNPNYFGALAKAFYKKFGTVLTTEKQLKIPSTKTIYELTKQIYNSKGSFYPLPTKDNMESLYNVFSTLQTQYQLSAVSFYFSKIYKKDLLNFIKDFTNIEEQNIIFDKVKNYKQYLKEQ